MKQTAVEWLAEQMMHPSIHNPYIEQAKEMEKEQSYNDMQEYAAFCIECDRKEMPLLLVEDWYEHYKNK